MNVQGFTTFSGPVFILLSPTTDISFVDNITWNKGAHTFKGGGIVIRNRKDQNGSAHHAGNIAFNPSGNTNTTGNAFADALLSNYRTSAEANDDPIGFFRFTQYEAYAQDNWRAHRTFSVEYGIRYQTARRCTRRRITWRTSTQPFTIRRAVTANFQGRKVALRAFTPFSLSSGL